MSEGSQPQAPSYRYEHELNVIDDNYRNYYQVFVYSFCDSNGDGIGDLAGVTSGLDYIQDMGFNGIWLSPIMPSDSYHKYSVKDYYAIDEQYGTMEDFEKLAAECEKAWNKAADRPCDESQLQRARVVQTRFKEPAQ